MIILKHRDLGMGTSQFGNALPFRRAQADAGRLRLFAGTRFVGLLVAVHVLAGCTTAPSWPTAQECEADPPRCAIPSWQIAQDMNALSTAAAPTDPALADPAKLPTLSPTNPRPAYRIGPLDELTITVWGAKEIWSEITDQSQQPTRVTTVQDDGTIVLPLLKSIQVAGNTVNEALAKITDSYKTVLGATFQVDGQITKFRSKPVLLDGAINKPGIVYLSPEVRTLGEAISIAGGGFPETAELSKGILIREQQRYRIDYQGAQSGGNNLHTIELRPGDRIYFPSRETGLFYVLGEVLAPGAFSIPPKGISLMQGLALAKGPIMVSGDMTSIFLVRINESEPRIYRLTLADIMASRDIPIFPGDRIFVSATGLATWDRTLRQLLPFIGSTVIIHEGLGVTLP